MRPAALGVLALSSLLFGGCKGTLSTGTNTGDSESRLAAAKTPEADDNAAQSNQASLGSRKSASRALHKTLYVWQPLPRDLSVTRHTDAEGSAALALLSPVKALRTLGYGEDAEPRLASTADGNAIELAVITECGGDSCDADVWLIDEKEKRLSFLGQELGGVAVDSQLRFFLSDVFPDPPEGELPSPGESPVIQKTLLGQAGAKQLPFASCFSPTLVQGANLVLCRNAMGDILGVPLDEPTAPRKLWRSPYEHPQRIVSYAWIYPAPVRLVGDEAHWKLWNADESEVRDFKLPWKDLVRGTIDPDVTR